MQCYGSLRKIWIRLRMDSENFDARSAGNEMHYSPAWLPDADQTSVFVPDPENLQHDFLHDSVSDRQLPGQLEGRVHWFKHGQINDVGERN
ncbi:MAG: hypothetical protein HKL98_05790 [Burkholderiales bacterium]|nr:hypothetical protein [Burkholderiales bacterium]